MVHRDGLLVPRCGQPFGLNQRNADIMKTREELPDDPLICKGCEKYEEVA